MPAFIGARAAQTRGGVATRFGPLRAVSPTNWMAGSLVSVGAATTRTCGKWVHVIGSGDGAELRVAAHNFVLGGTAVATPGNTLTVNHAYLVEYATGGFVEITWGGVPGLAMADGAFNQLSDAILPSAFGRASFPRDAQYGVHYEADVPAGGKLSCHNFTPPNGAGCYAVAYNPAATTITNLTAPGAFTSAVPPPAGTRALSFLLLGRFASGDQRSFGGIGDSITESVGDRNGTSLNGLYGGFFGRALWSVSGVSGARGGINFGLSGGTINLWVASASSYAILKTYLPYCNAFIEQYGTNSFTNTNTGNANFYRTQSRTLWTNLLTDAVVAGGMPIRIGRTKLGPRTTGAWSAADGSDQASTNLSCWTVGGDVDLVNAALAADEGVGGRFDKYLAYDGLLRLDATGGTSSAAFHKWIASKTADGVHPLGTTAEDVAANVVRPWMAGL